MWLNDFLSYILAPLGLAISFISSNFTSTTSILDRTAFIFAFGDSYTTNGWNGYGDPLAPHNVVCTTAGPNWAISLTNLVGHSTLIDLAVSGSVSDSNVVKSRSLDFRGQTMAFLKHVAHSRKVPWTSRNSIFTVTFGTNNVNRSYKKAQGNGTFLYSKDLASYFNTVDKLYAAGARQFVFNNVIPFDRAQRAMSQGDETAAQLKDNINEFNSLLASNAATYCASKQGITCLVFDAYATFANLMDNYAAYGFATPSGYCKAYAKWSCNVLPQDRSCLGPVSSYVWWDGLHPSYAADLIWANALVAQLSNIS